MVSNVLVAVKDVHDVVRDILFNGQGELSGGTGLRFFFTNRSQHLENLH